MFFLWHTSRHQPIAVIGGRCRSRADNLQPGTVVAVRVMPCTHEQLAWSQCAVELVTSAAPWELVWYSSRKRNATVWRPSVRLSVCPAAYSPWFARGQHATRPAYISARQITRSYRHTWLVHSVILLLTTHYGNGPLPLYVCVVREHWPDKSRLQAIWLRPGNVRMNPVGSSVKKYATDDAPGLLRGAGAHNERQGTVWNRA